MNALWLVAGDLLLLAGLAVLSLALVGAWRFDDLLTRLHATSKVGSLGLALILLGGIATASPGIILRALLIAAFLVFTAPVSTFVIARAARRRGAECAREEGRSDGRDDTDNRGASGRAHGSGAGGA